MSAHVAERIVSLGRETLRLSARQDENGSLWIDCEVGNYPNGEWEMAGPLFRLRPAHLRAVASALGALAGELGVRA